MGTIRQRKSLMNQYERSTMQFFFVRARNWFRRIAKEESDGSSLETVGASDEDDAVPRSSFVVVGKAGGGVDDEGFGTCLVPVTAPFGRSPAKLGRGRLVGNDPI